MFFLLIAGALTKWSENDAVPMTLLGAANFLSLPTEILEWARPSKLPSIEEVFFLLFAMLM